MVEMKKYKLNDVCLKITDGSHFSPKAVDFGYPMYSVKDMNEFGFNDSDYKMISEDDFKSLVAAGCRPQKDDVLIAKDGSYLKYAFVCKEEKDEVILSSIAILRPNKDIIDPTFFSFLLRNPSVKKSMKYYVSGTALPRIVLDNFKKMEINIPGLSEQKKIGDMLSTLDKRIENLRAQNRVLEQTAKTIYDYTFLQCAGHQTTYNKTLNRNIPAGWEVKKLGDLCSIFTGKKDVSKRIPGDYAFFSCAPEKLSSNEYLYDGQAILVSGNGSYTGRVSYYDGKFDLYQRTYACVLKNTSASVMPYLYFTMKYLFEPAYSGGTHGSAIPYIVMNDLTNYSICWNSPAIESFVQRVSPMFKKRLINLKQIEALITKRNTLLPLLMTGQVEV
jgi:type I restriction enzyme S subunit